MLAGESDQPAPRVPRPHVHACRRRTRLTRSHEASRASPHTQGRALTPAHVDCRPTHVASPPVFGHRLLRLPKLPYIRWVMARILHRLPFGVGGKPVLQIGRAKPFERDGDGDFTPTHAAIGCEDGNMPIRGRCSGVATVIWIVGQVV